MGKKIALLCGCNYPGTNAALRGCINDVLTMKRILLTYKGFREEDIRVLIDTDNSYEQPTGANIKKYFTAMCQDAQPGDVIMFHFSGHGTQVPEETSGGRRPTELDKTDEALVPTDLNLIVDDDLKAIVDLMPEGVNLTCVTDCCHSGSMLDHDAVQIAGCKANDPGGERAGAVGGASPYGGGSTSGGSSGGLMSLAMGMAGGGSGGGGGTTAMIGGLMSMISSRGTEFKSRDLPLNMLTQMLSERSGTQVSERNVKSNLAGMFGADSSLKVSSFLQAATGSTTKTRSAGGGGLMMTMIQMCMKKTMGGGMGGASAQPVHNGPPPTAGKLSDDKGVLITGCQSNETSADACPGGDASKAYGALTNGIETMMKENPNLTYRELVTGVRQHLHEQGFSQNPCLECSVDFADRPFIC